MGNQGKGEKRSATSTKSEPSKKKARFDLPQPAKTLASKKDRKTSNKSKKLPHAKQQPTTSKAGPKTVKPHTAAAPFVAKVTPALVAPPLPTTFIVSVGSYERLLYGLSCTFVPSASSSTTTSPYELVIHPIFAFPAHLSSLRSLAISTFPVPIAPSSAGEARCPGTERKVGGKYLVSGGTDEVVKVWDLKRRKEVGTLDGDVDGTITNLRFVPFRNQLLVSTTSGSIALYRVRDWVLLRTLPAHKGRVNSVDPHPAGRVALSVGQDRMLRMWDLLAGKAVATLKMEKEGEVVRWSSDGNKFAVAGHGHLTLYALDMTPLLSLTATSRFHDVRFCFLPQSEGKEVMLVACEDGKTRVFAVPSTAAEGEANGGEPKSILEGHSNRVKMLDLLDVAYPSEASATKTDKTIVLCSTSSDGKINIYDLSFLSLSSPSSPLTPAASYDSDGSRLTCVTVVGVLDAVAKSLRKEMGLPVGAEDDESSEGSDSASSGDSEIENDVGFELEEDAEFEGINDGEEDEEEDE